ncbi:MAG: MarR family winged helix-turn-helix transcriptional regulator [Acidimicrobiales bacterium]
MRFKATGSHPPANEEPAGLEDTHREIPADPGTVDARRAPAEERTLARTAAWLAKQVELSLATVELSAPQYRVLGLLDERSAVSSDLAERLSVRPPSVTAIVDGLVHRGWVERRTVAGDRRRVDHVLTTQGRRTLSAADHAVASRLHEIVDSLDGEDTAARAYGGLAAWREAFTAYRRQRTGTR